MGRPRVCRGTRNPLRIACLYNGESRVVNLGKPVDRGLEMALRGLRGATVAASGQADDVLNATKELLRELIERNSLDPEDIASIIFTATPDISSVFPAAAARELGLTGVPLLGASELDVVGAPSRCIRVLLHVNTDKKQSQMQHVYLGEARRLRPDLA